MQAQDMEELEFQVVTHNTPPPHSPSLILSNFALIKSRRSNIIIRGQNGLQNLKSSSEARVQDGLGASSKYETFNHKLDINIQSVLTYWPKMD